jgi:Fic family protein
MSSQSLIKKEVMKALAQLEAQGAREVSSSQLLALVATSPATLKRTLHELVSAGQLIQKGKARSTRYRRVTQSAISSRPILPSAIDGALSPGSQTLIADLRLPLASRTPVTYQRLFVEEYRPNETHLIPQELAMALLTEGRMRGQQPAGTYARKVFEQLLIDLSWSSSQLEGNRFTLLATEELFKRGSEGEDADAIMLLNHKRAIEFLVDAVPEYGLTSAVIRNLQSLLMQDLLAASEGLGAIRKKIVNISDTVYVPSQVPSLLQEMLELVVERARQIKNPIEAAFFLWINIAYLQPFEDGNKRTSRLAANIPLLISNVAPLSFLDVTPDIYAYAMIGVYERLDPSLAVDLFAWTYRRSIRKYAVIIESLGAPDPFRLKYRERLSTAVQKIVRDGKKAAQVVRGLKLPKPDEKKFANLLQDELRTLSVHNCARYLLSMQTVEKWIAKGRRA